ncbi:MAG TPA: NAD(P)-dependent oxidoreductase [Bdellovibrio sp.]|uniref:NAD-dependent epimerase/dehydratase family protein n=1 Tax=Bdellovibrio sp. TaxID=28201 RepID=UPI002EE4E686
MKRKILITGGFGNLGSWLVEHFAKETMNDVYVLARTKSAFLDHVPYNWIQGDVTDFEGISKALSITFDHCIHTASLNEMNVAEYAQKALEVNAVGTRNLLRALQGRLTGKFIYFSTIHVYGLQEGLLTENSLPNPKNHYALTHLFAEYYIQQFAQDYKLQFLIYRLSNSYGCPTDKNTNKWYLVLNSLVKSAYEKSAIHLSSNGQASRDFVWMGDVCKIADMQLTDSSSGVLNLASGHSVKMIDIARKVQKVYLNRYGNKIDILVNEKDLTDYKSVQIDNSRLRSIIDYNFEDKMELEISKIFDLLES